MSWWGKVLGGAFGYMVGGPLGAMVGAAFGHQFDRGRERLAELGSAFAPGDRERMQAAFFTATFSVMGHVAKADGRVSRDEIQVAEAIMAQMNLTPKMREASINLFRQGKQPEFELEKVLDQFRRECHRRQTLIQVFIELQLQVAHANGRLDPNEEALLLRICDRLRFPREVFRRLEEMVSAEQRTWGAGASRTAAVGPTPRDAYAILNIASNASDAEVKRAYRRLMSQHHPDKLVAKGLPEEMIDLAKRKTQDIRRAYEVVKKERRLN